MSDRIFGVQDLEFASKTQDNSVIERILESIKKTKSLLDLEDLRIQYLGRKGILSQAFFRMKSLDEEERKSLAKFLNLLKSNLEATFSSHKQELENLEMKEKLEAERIDVSLFFPSRKRSFGHPISQIKDKIIEYFKSLGFDLCIGPLVEDDFHNFEALNIPKYHPARDMQDTFYFKDFKLLRTHTSPVQIRAMLSSKPPIKMICPGATFRRDYDLTHTPMFHQVEGLVVDESHKVSFANLKYVLEDFLNYLFGNVRVRFRSSFFPFTEPSAEVDISCVFCKGVGCRVCSYTTWLEVLGCGVVDERVFRTVGYENVSGYAFGMGIERLTMLSFGIKDLRDFFETHMGFLEQF